METPTILYLNNRYVNSLEELKVYFGSKLNEVQKGELIAAFRDKVLYDWLNEGGEAEKQIAGEMLPVLGQHFGNGEVLKKIAELFDVPNPLIADYKFVDHAEYLGCGVIGSGDEQTQHQNVPNDGVIHIKKGVTKCRIVFKFKILAPENDFLSLRLNVSSKIENAMSWETAKLDLVGKKNEIRTIELDIDVDKLCKECSLTLSHDNSVVGRVIIDNHENTDKVIEATEETVLEGFQKANIVARAYADNGYVFFDENGHDVLRSELQLLTNSMYPPNNKEFEFGFYYKKNQSEKMQLFYIDTNGWRDLGLFSDAILLDENRVSVCKDKEVNSFYGIIDKNGHYVLYPNDCHLGKMLGISKNGYVVCEMMPDVYGLFNTDTKTIVHTNEICVVSPNSNMICYFEEQRRGQLLVMENAHGQETFSPIENENRFWKWAYVYNNVVVASYDYHGRYHILYHDDKMETLYSKKLSFAWKNCFIQYGYTTEGNRLVSPFVIPLINSKTYEKKYKNVIVATKGWIVYQDDQYSKRVIADYFEKGSINNSECVFCISPSFCNNKYKCGFIYADDYGSIKIGFLQTDGKFDNKELVGTKSKVVIKQIVSYVEFLCVYYTKGNDSNKVYSIIVDKEGKEKSWENKFGDYAYYCGPFDGKFYYLSVNGDLFCKTMEENVGTRLSKNLSAVELYPLGLTKHFVIKTRNGEYQIVDNNGKGLSGIFLDFCLPSAMEKPEIVMDYIYNSQYLPIKNKEGKCGLIDTNGKIIVPCMYDEVEDLNSVFKREGIVVF